MNELKEAIIHNRKILLWTCLSIAAICLFLGKNFSDLIHNKLEQKRLIKISAQLDKEHEQLQTTLELLQKQNPAYIERLARVQYHMSLPGETEYRFKTK